MHREYASLPARSLNPRTTFLSPGRNGAPKVGLDDSAESVMTDFRKVTAITIDPDVVLETATRVMIRRGVRLLLVVDVENHVLGVITSTDIFGEKPMQFIQSHGGRHCEIRVRDIMTPQDKLEVVSMDDLRHARVGHVLATLRRTGRQHAAVVDEDEDGSQTLRGLLSASQLAKQLGEPVDTIEVANTFAEIEAALA